MTTKLGTIPDEKDITPYKKQKDGHVLPADVKLSKRITHQIQTAHENDVMELEANKLKLAGGQMRGDTFMGYARICLLRYNLASATSATTGGYVRELVNTTKSDLTEAISNVSKKKGPRGEQYLHGENGDTGPKGSAGERDETVTQGEGGQRGSRGQKIMEIYVWDQMEI